MFLPTSVRCGEVPERSAGGGARRVTKETKQPTRLIYAGIGVSYSRRSGNTEGSPARLKNGPVGNLQ